jgi:hypothetical protein
MKDGRTDGCERRASERGKSEARGGTDRGGRRDVVAAYAIVEETELLGRESVIVELDLVNHASK